MMHGQRNIKLQLHSKYDAHAITDSGRVCKNQYRTYTTISEICSTIIVPHSQSSNIHNNWEADGQNNHITIQEWCAPHVVFIRGNVHPIYYPTTYNQGSKLPWHRETKHSSSMVVTAKCHNEFLCIKGTFGFESMLAHISCQSMLAHISCQSMLAHISCQSWFYYCSIRSEYKDWGLWSYINTMDPQ